MKMTRQLPPKPARDSYQNNERRLNAATRVVVCTAIGHVLMQSLRWLPFIYIEGLPARN